MQYLLCLSLLTAATPIALVVDPHDTKTVRGYWTPVKGELGGVPMADAVLKPSR